MTRSLRLVWPLLLALIALICLLAPVLPLSDPLKMTMGQRFAGPSPAFPLGQDEMGRDILSRLVFGIRISLFIALSTSILSGVIGTAFGIIGGYMRGFPEILTLRAMDVVLCFPPLLLAMLAVTLYGPGPMTLIPVLAAVFVPGFTRIAYASVLTVRSQDYVEAVQAMGASNIRIMLKTILPNIMGPLLVQASFVTAAAVVLESGLSFLGLGVVPPSPSLGLMIGTGRAAIAHQPMLLVWPCLALVVMILVLNGVCDLLRDWLDPRSAAGAVLAGGGKSGV
ncbi:MULTISPECIES: ABC transporter permease [Agrobacterium]|jgi:peptide/nickel transport system permease protein|uniref:ABC transporter permease n=1 Tax=Agrobacterium tumefaciens TaxID=358 RepID=A0AA44FCC1_AGRTU|nr:MULTISPECIES: ABC transporter permease [Agrobacterium]MDP9562041.1 peptide/nickel transport system permease protein [Rhizobium nepotum]ADY66083.1 ABC transporter permease protein; agropinic acid inner-membrane protein [Agrobacterium tumefaciens]MQB06653.1 ABC transporter permease [Agrobacterium tumefaciens]NSL20160.1 ABC transporter permease [Agrobacterium tumefaciens]NSY07726.1 ABC transporter permease [Agrobacterium tumefaciens]